MHADDDDQPRTALIWATLVLPAYYSAVFVHRMFGPRDEHFTGSWEARIRYSPLAQGIPALLGFLAAAILTFVAWRDGRNAELTYARRSSTALEEKDHGTAEVGYTRHLGMRP